MRQVNFIALLLLTVNSCTNESVLKNQTPLEGPTYTVPACKNGDFATVLQRGALVKGSNHPKVLQTHGESGILACAYRTIDEYDVMLQRPLICKNNFPGGECSSSLDCPSGSICLCAGVVTEDYLSTAWSSLLRYTGGQQMVPRINRCMPLDCPNDCQGLGCALDRDECGRILGFRCLTPRDECGVTKEACKIGPNEAGYCGYNKSEDRWRCEGYADCHESE